MKLRHLLLAAAISALIGASAHADVLASYGFMSGSAAVTTKDSNVTAGSFSFAQGTNTNRGFSSTGGNIFARVNATGATDPASAISGNEYVAVTITPNPGFPLKLSHLTVDLGYSLDGVAVPAGIGVTLGTSVFSSIGGFTADEVLATQTFTAAHQGSGIFYQNVNVDLSGAAYQGITTPIEFRICYYDSIAGTSPTQPIHRIDNFTINGTVVTPLPLSMNGISLNAGTVQLLLSGAAGSPYWVYRSNDLQGPYYRKRWGQSFAGAFPGGSSELSLQEPKGTEPRGFYVASASEARARIMCVGDSITEGGTGYFIYRPVLNSLLSAAGYRFEFVGSKTNTQGGVTLKHEGYAGRRADEIAGFLATNFPNHIADIVLVHTGHNNDATVDSEATILNRVENATRSMITTCRTHNPKVIILLAQVITSSKLPKYSYIPNLNIRLAEVAADLHSAAQPVWIVNQAEGWDSVADTVTDQVHPTEGGATKMASKWFAAIQPLLE